MTLQELYTLAEGDYEAAKKVMMMDTLIRRMLPKYLEDHSCEKLLAAGEIMDPAGIFDAAHALKGVSASLGLARLSAEAGIVCEEFRPGKSRHLSDPELREHLEIIRALHEKAVSLIRQLD